MLSNIDEKKVAYLVGYLAGDGNFENGRGKRTDRLSVTTVDHDVIDWIDENILTFTKHNPKMKNNLDRGIIAQQESYVKTFPASYSEDFKKYGILCLKVDRSIQNIKKVNYKYVLMGFLDSDGCISYSMRKDRDRLAGKVMFTHPSTKLLGQVQRFLMDELSIPSAIKPKSGEKCYMLSFSKLSDIKKFGDYIYSDPSHIVLKRKYHKYQELCKILKTRVEDGTLYPKEFMQLPEYWSLVGSIGNQMYSDTEKEYPSITALANKHGIDKHKARDRCSNNTFGWYKRPKTETEKEDFKNYVNKKCKKLFKKWLEDNPDFY